VENFRVLRLEKWERLEENGVQAEERPHVVPVSLEAVDFMEEFAKQSSGMTPLFGGFYDPVSILQTEGGPIKAFRFQSMEQEQEPLAIAKAETRFRIWKDQKYAAHLKLRRS
jgi:hypothetical protein